MTNTKQITISKYETKSNDKNRNMACKMLSSDVGGWFYLGPFRWVSLIAQKWPASRLG